jgi:hypothetical protein
MAPEHFDGGADMRSDNFIVLVWCYIGMINFGIFPFKADTNEEYREAHSYSSFREVNNDLFSYSRKMFGKGS